MAISPYLRIIDLSAPSGSGILATSSNIVDYSFGSELDKVGPFSAEIPAGDPGDGASLAFGEALLKATGNTPKPLLLSLSLDNGTNFDSHRLVRNPLRTLNFQRRTLREEGTDIGDALTLAVVERATYTQVSLDDALNGIPDFIVSASTGGIRHLSTIPYLSGILTRSPAAGMGWQAGLELLLQFSGTINPAVDSLETSVDIDSTTVLSALTTICNRLAGSFSDPFHGHFVIDPSDATLNLSGSVDWGATAAANSVVVGHYPSSTTHLTFNATSNIDVDETTTARVHLDQATIQSDDSVLYKAANLIGGKNIVGIPDDAKIHGLAILNGTTATMTGGSQWYDALLVAGLAFGDDIGGGIYFLHQDGKFRPIPGSPVMTVHSLAFDEGAMGFRDPGLVAGGKTGVFYSTSVAANNFSTATTWIYLDGLNADIVRIQIKSDPDNHDYPVIFALAKGKKERSDAIWRWAFNGTIWKWDTVLDNQAIVDFVATDYRTIWVAEDKPTDHLYQWSISSTGAGTKTLDKGLPHGGVIRSVHEVVTVSPASDSVWVLLDGDTSGSHKSPAYYTLNVSGTWSSFINANLDDTIKGPNGEQVNAHGVVGLGVTFDPAVDTGTLVNAILSTSQGALWTNTTFGVGANLAWKRVALAGLDNFPIEQITSSEAVFHQGVHLNPMYAVSGDDILVSNSSGRYWFPLKGKNRTDLGVHLSDITLSVADANGVGTGFDLPNNAIVTWGTKNSDGSNMTTSPLGLASSTHVYVASANPYAVPQGLFWQRYQDDHQDYQYKLVSQTCHLPGTEMAQLPELQTNSVVTASQASKGVAIVARRFMGQHSQPVLHLNIQSSFDDPLSALRTLRASHKVSVIGSINITDFSSLGDPVTTHVMNFNGSEDLWVISHQIRKGPGMTAITNTVISNRLLETPPSPEDMANSLTDSIHSVRVWK